MRLAEYVSDGGFWGIIQGQSPSPIPFLVDCPPEQLDANLAFEYGERTILEKVERQDKEVVAKYIVSVYFEKWARHVQSLADDVDITAKNIRIRNEEGEETSSDSKTSDVENKVSAYNETDLVTESGNSNNEENEGVRNQTRKVTEKMTDLSVIFQNLQTMQKLDIIRTATRDVANTISHSIY